MLLGRIELPTSSLPMTRSTTELQQLPFRQRHVVRCGEGPMAISIRAVNTVLTKKTILLKTICVTDPKSTVADERARRLTEALRENLRKRKAQAREAKAPTPPKVES